MGKFFGNVGYGMTIDSGGGVWIYDIVERQYYGDVLKVATKWQTNGRANDDIAVSNKISIVADGFANENFSNIVYVDWMGVKWKVNEIEVQRPRLILSIGGEWHGEQVIPPTEP